MLLPEPPTIIYLQFHGDTEEEGPVSSDDVTWCWHGVHDCDIKYIKLDAVLALIEDRLKNLDTTDPSDKGNAYKAGQREALKALRREVEGG